MAAVPSTRVDRVWGEVRADILAGRRRPGAKLLLAELVERHSASMGVVREALSRLVAQGLVESEPQHGFYVARISVADLQHLTDARCSIETMVLREAISHAELEWEGELLSVHHQLARTSQMAAGDPDRFSEDWVAKHGHFHRTLLDGCPNPRLRAIAANLRDAAELYRRWSAPLGRDQDRDIAGEHEALLLAALDRDADRAVILLSEHIRHTTRVLLDTLEPDSADTAPVTHPPAHDR